MYLHIYNNTMSNNAQVVRSTKMREYNDPVIELLNLKNQLDIIDNILSLIDKQKIYIHYSDREKIIDTFSQSRIQILKAMDLLIEEIEKAA